MTAPVHGRGVLERPDETSRERWRHALVRVLRGLAPFAVLAGIGAAAYFTRDRWLPLVRPAQSAGSAAEPAGHGNAPSAPSEQVLLSAQAQKNLRLTAKPLKAQTFWKTIAVPGMVIDSPGTSDRGVVAPLTGIVSRIHRLPGNIVRPGEVLFTVKLFSESLQLTQTDLFKASQDITLKSR